jgi:hypothetical protein
MTAAMMALITATTMWTCSARSGLGQLYLGQGTTKLEAKKAALDGCHVHHPVCYVTQCTQTTTEERPADEQ